MLKTPPSPPGLTSRGVKLWRHHAEVLVKRRYLAEDGGDLLALEMMVREWDRYIELLEEVYSGKEPEGVSLTKMDGTSYRNPKDIALNAALHNAARAMVEFGLTPSARARARGAAAPAPQPFDPYDEFRILPGGKKFGGAP
jgi:P27 family predicted phage terminase small subunit